MRARAIVGTAGRISGLLGFSLAVLAAVGTVDPDSARVGALGAILPLGPAGLAVASVPLIWVYLLTNRGYRRLPFWLAAAAGTAAILGAVSYRGIPGPDVHAGIAIAAGIVAFVCARFVMTLRLMNARRFVFVFGALAAAGVLLSVLSPAPASDARSRPVYDGELERLFGRLDPASLAYREQLEPYLDRVVRDETIDAGELERIVDNLNRRIVELEAELERFSVVAREKDAYAEQVARLRRELEQITATSVTADDFEMVSGYREAVRPGVPLVRDFAVRLAAEHPGPFHRDFPGAAPSREGVLQALTIHRYAAAEWKYVNDPVFAIGNYYSPADRTIALGLAGDCDDFATVIASAVEAIGGRARIVHGTCDVGAHAWAELFIGDRAAWRETLSILSERYPSRTIESIRPNNSNDHWLPLDWQVGLFTCGDSPRVQYVSR